MDAVIVVAGVGLGYLVFRRKKTSKKKKPALPVPGVHVPTDPGSPGTPALPQIDVAGDCASWSVPDAWILQVGQPRLREMLVDLQKASMAGVSVAPDAVGMTYQILEGELGRCPIPAAVPPAPAASFLELQADVPGAAGYYPHAAILGLYGHFYEAIVAALGRYAQSLDVGELLFPLP